MRLAIKKFKKIEDFTGEALEDLIAISTNKELLLYDDCWNTKHAFKILIFRYQYQYFEILISILILILLFGRYWSWYWYWHQEKYWSWYWSWSWFFGRETIDVDIDIEICFRKNIDLDIDPKFDIVPPLLYTSFLNAMHHWVTTGTLWNGDSYIANRSKSCFSQRINTINVWNPLL